MQKFKLHLFLIIYFMIIIFSSFLVFGIKETIKGFIRIQISPGRLISDYFVLGGIGGSFLNASLLSIISIILIIILKMDVSGPVIASVFTIFGFALFGKNIISVLTLWIGVYISSLIARKKFIEYIFIAFFGSALSPVFSIITFELTMTPYLSLFLGILFAIIVGILLPPTAIYVLRFHQGYNLYNVGMTAGFLSLFISSILRNLNVDLKLFDLWSEGKDIFSTLIVPLSSIIFIIAGILKKPKNTVEEFIKLQKENGRLPSDFLILSSKDATFLNMGILTLIYFLYVLISRSPINGPVLGGLFTIFGFAAFGKNIRNCIPILLGVFVTSILLNKPLNSPAIILGALFSTTLAPLSGTFGFFVGFIGGVLHIILVQYTAGWVGGLNLYNNGFAGGLVATFIVAIIDWFENTINFKLKK